MGGMMTWRTRSENSLEVHLLRRILFHGVLDRVPGWDMEEVQEPVAVA